MLLTSFPASVLVQILRYGDDLVVPVELDLEHRGFCVDKDMIKSLLSALRLQVPQESTSSGIDPATRLHFRQDPLQRTPRLCQFNFQSAALNPSRCLVSGNKVELVSLLGIAGARCPDSLC